MTDKKDCPKFVSKTQLLTNQTLNHGYLYVKKLILYMHSGMPCVLVFINEIRLDNVPFTSVYIY